MTCFEIIGGFIKSTEKSNTKPSTNVPRTTSAPATRPPEKKLTSAEEQEKNKLYEQAFQAWLSKKKQRDFSMI